MSTKTLSFYTIGSEFTQLIRNLISEGAFSNAYDILNDGGMPEYHLKIFFMGGLRFEGDTRDGEGLSVLEDEPMNEAEFTQLMISAIKTLIYNEDMQLFDIFYEISSLVDEKIHKNVKALFKVIPRDMLLSMMTPEILRQKGFALVDKVKSRNFDGVILKDGRIVQCGYQMHRDLYPVLYGLNLVSSADWIDCDDSIHITSGQCTGTIAHKLQNMDIYHDEPNNITEPMLETLVKNKDMLGFYGFGAVSIMLTLLEYYENKYQKGGKYGKLMFLKHCYPDIYTPEISLSLIEGKKNCIRTSPKKSMAGILNSKFDVTDTSIQEIESDYEQYKDLIKGNELYYFYQEFLQGANGVAHYRNGEFTFDLSDNQGDIVKGKKGWDALSVTVQSDIKDIVQQLYKDLERDIQIEFVLVGMKVYVVQLRTLGVPKRDRSYPVDHTKVITNAKSFNAGVSDVLTLDDVLIVNNECEPSELVGKKALIVRDNVEFSHALALSYSLNIPSIYAVGDIELPHQFKIDTKGKDGYILKV